MDTKELLKKVRKIEIKTRGISRHIFQGEYHSAFKGRGMSFSEVRAYQYGDDVRNIDWNVTARLRDPHVKVFEEERELTVVLLVDVSGSSYFGTRQHFKQDVITELCAVLAFSAIQNNDKVGVIFFSEDIELFIPPKKGRQHILRIIRELINFEPTGKTTRLDVALRYLNNVIKKRSICFVLSDFLCDGYEAPLRVAARRHDLVGIQLYDPLEVALPNVGMLRTVDAEQQTAAWVDTSSPQVREAYERWFREHRQQFQTLFSKNGADRVSIPTDASYTRLLLQFFRQRSNT
jgi:uncharacterized protein (DUF58 family)